MAEESMGSASQIGMLGPCVFVASEEQIRTFSNFNRTATARYVDHEVISQKQVSEFTGADLDTVEFSMMFNGDFGVDPVEETDKLREAASSGEPVLLMIGGTVYGLWTIREIPEEWLFTYNDGSPQIVTVQISITEFVDSVPTTAQSKMAEDETRRSETGRGGPQRLPGTGGGNANLATTGGGNSNPYAGWVSN